jgi:hypothetical protein
MTRGNMVARLRGTLLSGCVAWLVALPVGAAVPVRAEPPPGQILLPDLAALEPQAKDSVLISLDASLLGIAARFLDSNQPEDRELKDIITGLQGVYVRSYTFDHAFANPSGDLEALRKQLHTPCWQSIVSVHNAEAQSTVDIYICQLDRKARGLAIIAVEPRELTIVNIVGAIDLEKLHRLEGHFGIPRLPDSK